MSDTLMLMAAVVAAFVMPVYASTPDHPDLNGNWRLEPSRSEVHSHLPSQLTWQIEQNDGTIHLVQRSGEKKEADEIRCATDGKDCHVKSGGHAATLNFYYNGPILVELQSEGQNRDNVTKRRMQVSGDGNTLTVDIIHITPEGKPPEKLVLTKQSTVAQAGH